VARGSTRLLRPALALVTSAALILSCASRIWPSAVGVRKGDWIEHGASGNWARSQRNQKFEWPYNHPFRQRGEPGLVLRAPLRRVEAGDRRRQTLRRERLR
jgi:hypothetical protein